MAVRVYPMDKGYSWLVLASSFLINFIILGQVLNFGIYFVVFLDDFESTRKCTSLAGALAYALMCLTGPVAGVLQKRYGARRVIILGGLFSTLGFLLSYFALELWHLYITYGIMVGLGYGLCVSPSLSILPEYFEKHRYFSTTFSSIGASSGSLIFAPLTLYLIETYTWRGSMLIQAGFCLQLIIFGYVCKSRRKQRQVQLSSLFDIGMLKNRLFALLILDGILLGGASFTFFSMINNMIIERGLTKWQSAQLVSVAALSNTGARITAAFISHLKCTDRTLLYSLVTLMCSLGIIACVFCYDFWSFAIALVVIGFSLGMKFSQPPNVIIDLFGVEKLVIAIGYFMFSIGFGGFCLPLLAGWLADQTETQNAFILTAINCLIGAAFCFALLFFRRRLKKTQKSVQTDTVNDVVELRKFDRHISID